MDGAEEEDHDDIPDQVEDDLEKSEVRKHSRTSAMGERVSRAGLDRGGQPLRTNLWRLESESQRGAGLTFQYVRRKKAISHLI